MKSARLCIRYSLVFFLLAIAPACKQPGGHIALVWKDGKAVALTIPNGFIRDRSEFKIKHSIRVVLRGSKSKTGIFGNFVMLNGRVEFQPIIPLSAGLSYDIRQDDRLIGHITVPVNTGKATELLAIYPQQDTVPENLLKFYFKFSHPMRTGEVLNHVYLLDKNKDTMRNVFLNLQPELWDSTGKVLTLWLDPGRIKRGLVLNHELGNPLKKLQTYQLVVSRQWKDTRGLMLAKTYTKNFVAGDRDGDMPDINKWRLTIPKAGSNEPLIINTNEPLDHYLLKEAVAILDSNGKMLYSAYKVSDNDKTLKLTPLPEWAAGKYTLIVQAKLEDLAGNNLNRVFDRDIHKDKQQNREFFVRGFEVK